MFHKGNLTDIMLKQSQAINLIESFFAVHKCLVGKPVFTVNPDKVIVQLTYYAPFGPITNASLTALGESLTRCWDRTVEVRLIRLNYCTLDSSIFTKLLAINGEKYSFNRILEMLNENILTAVSDGSVDENTVTPTSHITGVKIKLSGRLTTQRSGPRQTVLAGRLGSSAKGKYRTVDYSKYTAKNKLGAFTMKV